ncbi:PilZ domain-containing protein [Candidatus Sumerlaeota bacterium]|nr:PilZ domain-containing protein [Candidatus Sumerlaeota bacterium]
MMIPLRKFFNRKEEDRHNVRIKLNQRVGFAIGDIFKTDKAILKDLSLSGARFELPNGNPIPGITHFHNLPFKMQIPGTRDIISATIDIVRIYTRDENDNSVYGFAVEFEEMSKEDREKLETFIRSKIPQTE